MSEVLIIGGGVSGITAGICALKAGHRVTVCEKNPVSGGNLTAWKRQGYTIDNCIHWLTGTNKACSMYGMWELTGALGDDVEVIKPGLLYTVEHEGESLSLLRDLDAVVARMFELSPEDKKEIKDFYKVVTAICGVLGISGVNKDQKLPYIKLLPYVPAFLKYYNHSTGEIAARFKHPLLRKYFTYLMGTEFSAFDFAFVTATFVGDNADLPRGMSLAMAQRMEERFLSLGGRLLLKKKAERINLEGGHAVSVSFADGEEISADYFITAVDPEVTFGKLLDVPVPKDLKKQIDNPLYRRFSSYHIQYGLDMERAPFEENLFIDVPDEYRAVVGNHRIMLREFSLEPEFAPQGKSTIQVMIYCYEEGAERFVKLAEDKAAYKERKEKLERVVREIVVKRFPEFEDRLTLLDMWTPATFERFTGAKNGAYMSFINPKKTAPTDLKYTLDGVDNVILASQWQISPGGLPNAAAAGIKAARIIPKEV